MGVSMAFPRPDISTVLFLTILGMISRISVNAEDGADLLYDFYEDSCPEVENIIFNSIYESYLKNSTVAPGVLRMTYHDCFVRGCDASLLLKGPDSEISHPINAPMHGFEAIDAAKEEVEKACPGVVSCADVLQFAVRDVVVLTGGCGWRVPAGRRDGLVSNSTEVPINIPTPDKKVPDLLRAFQKKGLNAAQMVTLTGAHTIGRASCLAFDDRIHNFSGDRSKVDPSLPQRFASILKKKCPLANLTKRVNLEVTTPRRFDSQYYKNLIHKIGLLTSDMSMVEDSDTQGQVYMNTNWRKFSSNFAEAMIDLGKVDVLTGQSGEIRLKCRLVN